MLEADATALVNELIAAWNEHDMHRFAACFAEDAEFVNVGGMWWRGRPEIEGRHAEAHGGRLGATTLESRVGAYRDLGRASLSSTQRGTSRGRAKRAAVSGRS
jgi:uncharacterized protein (TIGR02246 family)